MKKKNGPTHFRNSKGAVFAFCGVELAQGRWQPKWTTLFRFTSCEPCKARIKRVWG